MLFYTQLIFIKPGKEKIFHSFEDKVIPFLSRYNGKLMYRLRPQESDYIEINDDAPYEIHLVSFQAKQDFLDYANDPSRQQYLEMKNESVEKIVLIEGKTL